jgi:hypothetical protein
MSSRSKNRLVTALLLLLVATGGFGASFVVARSTQVTVTASTRRPGRPQQLSELPGPVVTPPPIHRDRPQRIARPPEILVPSELFQRPPPAILLSLT